MCTHNYGQLLQDALRSLAAQKFTDFELLIVDDGSTDRTEEVVSRFSPRLHQCVYLKKSHSGLADSRNVGLRAATGTHIAFLDADDFWSPDYLDAMRGAFESTPEAELVGCDGVRVDGSGGILALRLVSPDAPPVCGRLHTIEGRLSFICSVRPSTMMFTKSLYGRIGPFDTSYPIAHDQHWVTRAVKGGAFCVSLDRRLILYREHGQNMTSRPDEVMNDWLSVYANQWNSEAAAPALQMYFRRFLRGSFRALLAGYPARLNRMLLRRALEAGAKDWLLKVAFFLTYLGLCPAARYARAVKRAFRGFSGPKMRIDLSAPPEILFATLPGPVERR
ncbi:MAG: glycosyltransferase [Planctomycetes bacterium]|nr:glycosyltransferase [Planctomycetota bacterium]